MEIGERIKKIRTDKNLNQSEFAERIGIGQAALSALEKGIRNVTDRNILLICENFNVNEHWLRTGEEPMFIETNTTIIEELAKEYKLDDLEKKIVEHFVKLDSGHREAIKNYVLSLAAEIGNASEIAATTAEEAIEAEVEKELNIIRQELLDEKKAKMLSASQKHNETG
ncbi:helix-turn-helix transcriptional regulator [Lysinibacillus macroides]|uniref:helix-turn-helix domain-containing protein n=1 Tax=Lysinibacillus macroides TaxID=33935 RepID=UPI0006B5777C|nr:helix-turn-helix transcriptional regulator [Lysinibacillus macroides]QPR68883.1 helix-turn-helix transcriptional regulator [Lysinibacillus macroides]